MRVATARRQRPVTRRWPRDNPVALAKPAAVLAALAALLCGGCGVEPKAATGFRLPDGDADTGRETFVRLSCNSCHTVRGEDLPAPETPGPLRVQLGGEVSRAKTYGELVTSVINPSHRLIRGYPESQTAVDSQSRMPNYNDTMTVTELIDLVAFLQTRYEVVLPVYQYRGYEYGL